MNNVRRLVWDEWNEQHIARHECIRDDVEEACHSDAYIDEGKKGRLRLLGLTNSGRLIAVILDPEDEPGTYYVVTARPASRKERRLYQQERGGETT